MSTKHLAPEPLVFPGDRVIETFPGDDGVDGLIIEDKHGYFRLREWDKVNGWLDRTYASLTGAKKALVGEY